MDELRTALDRVALAEKAYREKYGEESLDRVIYRNPLNISAEEANKAAKTLEMAVAKNKPLEQVPVEFGNGLFFNTRKEKTI